MAKQPPSFDRPRSPKYQFDARTSPALWRAQGNGATLEALSGLERRAAAISDKVIRHAERFQDRWVAREAIRIWERHNAQGLQHPTPRGAGNVSQSEVLAQAERVVQARTNRRLTLVNRIKTRMQNAFVRNLEHQDQQPAQSRDLRVVAEPKPSITQTFRRKQ